MSTDRYPSPRDSGYVDAFLARYEEQATVLADAAARSPFVTIAARLSSEAGAYRRVVRRLRSALADGYETVEVVPAAALRPGMIVYVDGPALIQRIMPGGSLHLCDPDRTDGTGWYENVLDPSTPLVAVGPTNGA